MEDLLNGRSIQLVAWPVVKDGKGVRAPAPTHPHQAAEGAAGEQRNRPRNVSLESAKVWTHMSVSISVLLAQEIFRFCCNKASTLKFWQENRERCYVRTFFLQRHIMYSYIQKITFGILLILYKQIYFMAVWTGQYWGKQSPLKQDEQVKITKYLSFLSELGQFQKIKFRVCPWENQAGRWHCSNFTFRSNVAQNVVLVEWMIWQEFRSKYFIPMKFGGHPVKMAIWHQVSPTFVRHLWFSISTARKAMWK